MAVTSRQYRTNLNCASCEATVRPFLDGEPAIAEWSLDTGDPRKVLTVTGEGLTEETVSRLVGEAGFKVLGPLDAGPALVELASPPANRRSFLETYQPLLLVVGLLGLGVAALEWQAGSFDWRRAMRLFMGGFFLAFSFFKLLDVPKFADAFATYDLLAAKSRSYALAYPFVELVLGVAYLAGVWPTLTNGVTLAVMLLGLAGVTQALRERRRIQCACLGTVFDLPMSKVTFVEDAVMAGMAAGMLCVHITS